MPSYCSGFRCTADRCTDNCCIGWEIDIDSCTMEFYRNVKGEFGSKLSEYIDDSGTSCFRLSEGNRCPFLNADNLCDIFINLGEEHLCQICTDHPRYFEWFNGVKEGGTGLCCEESARLIITDSCDFSYTETEIPSEDCAEYDEELFSWLFEARNRIIAHLQNRKLTVDERISDILLYAEELQFRADNSDYRKLDIMRSPELLRPDVYRMTEFMSRLEPLDGRRPDYLRRCLSIADKINCTEFSCECSQTETYLEKLAVYFIWRHFLKGVFSGEFYSSVFFTAVSVGVIRFLAQCHWYENGHLTEQEFIVIAKDYSKETEYSDDNLNAVFDEAYSEETYII